MAMPIPAQMAIAATLWVLYSADVISPWWIVFLGFLNGVATGFQTAAWQSFVPLLVPRENLLDAVKLNSVQFTMARAIGPAFAGATVKAWGTGAAILANTLTYGLVIAALGWQAEVLAKGALLAGPEDGLAMVADLGADALLVDHLGGLHPSPGFARFTAGASR